MDVHIAMQLGAGTEVIELDLAFPSTEEPNAHERAMMIQNHIANELNMAIDRIYRGLPMQMFYATKEEAT